MEKLIVAMLDVRNLHFEENRAAKLLQSMTSQYQPYAPDTFRRFGPMWGPWWDAKGAYGNNLRDMGTFFTGRYDGFPAVMQDGALPRKTFSMGAAADKRFYLECRKIK
jgi:hypothetical protein